MRRLFRALLIVVALGVAMAPLHAADGQAISSTTCPGAGCTLYTVSGLGSVGIQLTGPFVGTVTFEQSNDGVTWFALTLYTNAGASATSTTATGFWTGSVAGANFVRVKFSAYTSGTATVYETTARAAVGAVAAPAVNTGSVTFTNGTVLSDSANGKLLVTGTTPMVQLGGTTSSFPAFKQASTTIQLRFSDDSGFASMVGDTFQATNRILMTGSATLLVSATAPTISSGFGTSPTVPSNNGTASFTINVGTGGVATSGVIGLPAATTGWNCYATDQTTNVVTRQTASTTTTATVTAASAWTASDILIVSCFAR